MATAQQNSNVNHQDIEDKLREININSEIREIKDQTLEVDGGPQGKVGGGRDLAPPVVTPTLTRDEDEAYSTSYEERGGCIIFNHKTFNKRLEMNERSGTDADRDRVKYLFKHLGFKVDIFDDLTVKEIKEKLHYYAYEVNHWNYDCFVMVFMSHGEEGQLYGKDGIFKSDDLFSDFTADNCPSLAGKPKMFFIQACRGDRLDSGRTLIPTDQTDSGSLSMYKIPNHADFLVCWSTVPGFDHARFLKEKGGFLGSSLSEHSTTFESSIPLGSHLEKAHSCNEEEEEEEEESQSRSRSQTLDSSIECACQLRSSSDTLDEDENYSCPACHRGHYSWRNTTHGSWFIQSIVDVFGKYNNYLDVLSMMTYVNRHMILNFESNCPSPSSKHMHGKKQSACNVSTLMRNVYLKPKK